MDEERLTVLLQNTIALLKEELCFNEDKDFRNWYCRETGMTKEEYKKIEEE